MSVLLTFNAGSSTIKLGLFDTAGPAPRRLGAGVIDLQREPLTLRVSEDGGGGEIALRATVTADLREVIDEVLDRLAAHFSVAEAAAGHRIVHGGDRFAGPVLIDDAILAAIEELVPLAPLHQPHSLRLIRAVRRLRPHMPQTASFDTAFHQSQDELVRCFALPRALYDAGIKRYGFHGLSYKYIAGHLARIAPEVAAGRVVVAHLGSGASLCGLHDGVSRDSSMGFSTLDGIPMGTRCGALDPGVLLHLLKQRGFTLDELEDLLYHRSGLLGVSGISADSRALLASPAPEAAQALELFALRIARETASLATTLGGLDGFVFTAGIGEHQPAVRAAVCRHLAWLGLRLDEAANRGNAERIDAADSRIAAFVIPTNEEQVIAEESMAVLANYEVPS